MKDLQPHSGFKVYGTRVRAPLVSLGCWFPRLAYFAICECERQEFALLAAVVSAWGAMFADESVTVRDVVARISRARVTEAERTLAAATRAAIKDQARAIDIQAFAVWLRQRVGIVVDGKTIIIGRQRDHTAMWRVVPAGQVMATNQDQERAVLTRMMRAWCGVIGDRAATVQAAVRIAYFPLSVDELTLGNSMREAIMASGRTISTRALGVWMRRHSNRIVNGKQIVSAGERDHVRLWKVETMPIS